MTVSQNGAAVTVPVARTIKSRPFAARPNRHTRVRNFSAKQMLERFHTSNNLPVALSCYLMPVKVTLKQNSGTC